MPPTASLTSVSISPTTSPVPSAECPVAPEHEEFLDRFARAMEIANGKWAGQPFEVMNQACLSVMAQSSKIELRNPPRIP